MTLPSKTSVVSFSVRSSRASVFIALKLVAWPTWIHPSGLFDRVRLLSEAELDSDGPHSVPWPVFVPGHGGCATVAYIVRKPRPSDDAQVEDSSRRPLTGEMKQLGSRAHA